MKILITGANGFIGRNLIQDLKQSPGNELYALSRKSFSPEGVVCLTGDVLDKPRLMELFEQTSFDAVIHLAAITEHHQIVDNRFQTFDTNLKGTINLLECFNAYCKGALFLYASTGKVYGKTNQMPITETAVTNPQNILGKSKRITEEVIDFYAVPENKYLICRIFNIYGEFQRRSFVVPTIIDQLEQPYISLGNLKDLRDYLYIRDLCSAIMSCLDYRQAFAEVDVVNIGSGEPACVQDILREMEQLLERKIEVCIDRSRMRSDETSVEFCDHSKLTRLTGWKPRYTLPEGLSQTLKYEGVIR